MSEQASPNDPDQLVWHGPDFNHDATLSRRLAQAGMAIVSILRQEESAAGFSKSEDGVRRATTDEVEIIVKGTHVPVDVTIEQVLEPEGNRFSVIAEVLSSPHTRDTNRYTWGLLDPSVQLYERSTKSLEGEPIEELSLSNSPFDDTDKQLIAKLLRATARRRGLDYDLGGSIGVVSDVDTEDDKATDG